eukprot:971518-Prymnesium_polylepis.2
MRPFPQAADSGKFAQVRAKITQFRDANARRCGVTSPAQSPSGSRLCLSFRSTLPIRNANVMENLDDSMHALEHAAEHQMTMKHGGWGLGRAKPSPTRG